MANIALLTSEDGKQWAHTNWWVTPKELLDRWCKRLGEENVLSLGALLAATVNGTGVVIEHVAGVVYPEGVYLMPGESEYLLVVHRNSRARMTLRYETMRVIPFVDATQKQSGRKRRAA